MGISEFLVIVIYCIIVSPLLDPIIQKYDAMNMVFEFKNKQRKEV